jgi:hypothetical protein
MLARNIGASINKIILFSRPHTMTKKKKDMKLWPNCPNITECTGN